MLNAQSASKNGAIPHINRSIYSIEATSKSCLQLFIAVTVLYILLKKKQKMMEPYMKKRAIYGPGLRYFSVLNENGIVSDRYENNLCRVSDRHEVRPL